MSEWSAWIGRQESRRDHVDEASVSRWLAALDREKASDGNVPQAYHWCLCLPDAPTTMLGEDGHPSRDESPASFLPPVPLPRRMWAASKMAFLAPLRLGQTIIRNSRIASVTEKRGGSGLLVFADIAHETHADGVLAVREQQTIVYREASPAGAPLVPPPLSGGEFNQSHWVAHRSLIPSAPLLFRYSALTFNSHRIHYDLPYATQEEGYRGLVVHGPLTATLLLDLARRHYGDNVLTHFEFRGTSPAVAGERLHLALSEKADSICLGAFADDGRQVMTASARRAEPS